MNQRLLNRPPLPGLALLPHKGNAQSHYLLTDGALATTLDEPRRIPLGTTGETTLSNNFVESPGPLAVDVANNGSLVARVRNTTPGIVAIRLTAPYQVST
ncbi:hypothetical protein [Spirosoma spitsbergense]|uniref:hypothetical protein n=1 Tax=Spirosoma spitsbergense TaxID=431554 RepID=UPI0003713B3B|nr:hypothetical protein [Spirosoma spitsbergense]